MGRAKTIFLLLPRYISQILFLKREKKGRFFRLATTNERSKVRIIR